ncbi:MAG: hypothetical protein AAF668_13950 [Pseudomonadota bacterium]
MFIIVLIGIVGWIKLRVALLGRWRDVIVLLVSFALPCLCHSQATTSVYQAEFTIRGYSEDRVLDNFFPEHSFSIGPITQNTSGTYSAWLIEVDRTGAANADDFTQQFSLVTINISRPYARVWFVSIAGGMNFSGYVLGPANANSPFHNAPTQLLTSTFTLDGGEKVGPYDEQVTINWSGDWTDMGAGSGGGESDWGQSGPPEREEDEATSDITGVFDDPPDVEIANLSPIDPQLIIGLPSSAPGDIRMDFHQVATWITSGSGPDSNNFSFPGLEGSMVVDWISEAVDGANLLRTNVHLKRIFTLIRWFGTIVFMLWFVVTYINLIAWTFGFQNDPFIGAMRPSV